MFRLGWLLFFGRLVGKGQKNRFGGHAAVSRGCEDDVSDRGGKADSDARRRELVYARDRHRGGRAREEKHGAKGDKAGGERSDRSSR